MQNYQIVKDEQALKDFINFLPEISKDETYYCCLFARKKYFPILKNDKSQLKRFTSNKDRLFHKIKQLECVVGSYTTGEGSKEITIPQEALALYITPNPRSNVKAAKNSLKLLAEIITNDTLKDYNLHQKIMTELQKAKSRSVFVDFDFDDVSHEEIEEQISSIINKDAYNILVTRGGFHLLVEPKKVIEEYVGKRKRNWFNEIKQIHRSESSDIENHGDNLIPVPGCTQGGFIPYLIEK